MKHILIVLALTMSHFADAQGWSRASGNNILTFEAGFTNFRPYQLNTYLAEAGARARDFLSLFETYGIGKTQTLALARSGSIDGTLSLHLFRPINVGCDSAYFRVRGWELMTSLYGFEIFPNARWIDFVLAPGVSWGSVKIRKEFPGVYNDQFEMFKNPFVAPMLRAELRFQIGPVSIGGRWSYRYDITKERWRKGSSETFPGYKMREMQYIVYLGWVLNRKEKPSH